MSKPSIVGLGGAMDQRVADALAKVFEDLDRARVDLPAVVPVQWSDVPGQLTASLEDRAGNTMGVSVMAGDTVGEQVASMADQIQEWVHEWQWRQGLPVAWPPCPYHRGTHPLKAVVSDGVAKWKCPERADFVAKVGGLR